MSTRSGWQLRFLSMYRSPTDIDLIMYIQSEKVTYWYIPQVRKRVLFQWHVFCTTSYYGSDPPPHHPPYPPVDNHSSGSVSLAPTRKVNLQRLNIEKFHRMGSSLPRSLKDCRASLTPSRQICVQWLNTSHTPGCVTTMLEGIGWESLQQDRRYTAQLSLLYRIQHGLVDIDSSCYFTQWQQLEQEAREDSPRENQLLLLLLGWVIKPVYRGFVFPRYVLWYSWP